MEPASLSTIYISSVIFFVALAARSVFAFLETSITALRLFKLKELATSLDKYHSLFQALEKTPHRVLITILLADSIADVTTAALATQIMETVFAHFHLSSGLGFSVGIALASMALLIVGEIIPKNLARGWGDRFLPSALWLMNNLYFLLQPIVSVLIKFSDYIVIKLVGAQPHESGTEWVSSEKEVKFLIDYISEKGLMESEKTAMLQSIFDLGRTPVREIMVPATDIVSMPVTASIRDILDVFVQHHFTRMPVYETKIDNIVGMIHLKDVFILLSRHEEKPVKDLVRPILFVPESMKVNQLLREFRQQHMHIAIVLNEHGSLIGLITLEDILEEIVGEISDELELSAKKIIPLKPSGWLINGSVPLEDLQEHLHIEFVTEGSVTLGGFLAEQLQHLPKKGERILYQGFYFQVQKASPQRVLQVLVFKADTHEPQQQDTPSDG